MDIFQRLITACHSGMVMCMVKSSHVGAKTVPYKTFVARSEVINSHTPVNFTWRTTCRGKYRHRDELSCRICKSNKI